MRTSVLVVTGLKGAPLDQPEPPTEAAPVEGRLTRVPPAEGVPLPEDVDESKLAWEPDFFIKAGMDFDIASRMLVVIVKSNLVRSGMDTVLASAKVTGKFLLVACLIICRCLFTLDPRTRVPLLESLIGLNMPPFAARRCRERVPLLRRLK